MKICKNASGKEVEIDHLPANTVKGLKNKKTWVSTLLAGEFAAFTPKNYKALCQAAKHGRQVHGSSRSFTLQILSDTKIFLEGSASNQYMIYFKSNDERLEWIRKFIGIEMTDVEILLN